MSGCLIFLMNIDAAKQRVKVLLEGEKSALIENIQGQVKQEVKEIENEPGNPETVIALHTVQTKKRELYRTSHIFSQFPAIRLIFLLLLAPPLFLLAMFFLGIHLAPSTTR